MDASLPPRPTFSTAPRVRCPPCPQSNTCPMYSLFTMASTLTLWQERYCADNHKSCARYQASLQGKKVPNNLLPNGTLLKARVVK